MNGHRTRSGTPAHQASPRGIGMLGYGHTRIDSSSPQHPKRPSGCRWTVIAFPGASLLSVLAGSVDRVEEGALLPLHNTLALQVSSVVREYALPSMAGIALHLRLPAADEGGSFGAPKLTDEGWPILFAWALQDVDGMGGSSIGAGLMAATGLPIAARLEVSIDQTKARWFNSWSRQLTAPSPPSPIHAGRAPAHEPNLSLSSDSDSATTTKRGLRTLSTAAAATPPASRTSRNRFSIEVPLVPPAGQPSPRKSDSVDQPAETSPTVTPKPALVSAEKNPVVDLTPEPVRIGLRGQLIEEALAVYAWNPNTLHPHRPPQPVADRPSGVPTTLAVTTSPTLSRSSGDSTLTPNSPVAPQGIWNTWDAEASSSQEQSSPSAGEEQLSVNGDTFVSFDTQTRDSAAPTPSQGHKSIPSSESQYSLYDFASDDASRASEDDSHRFDLERLSKISGMPPPTPTADSVTDELSPREEDGDGELPEGLEPAPPSPVLFPFDDGAKMYKAVAQFIYEAQSAALRRGDRFTVALSGALANVLSEALVKEQRMKWSAWHVALLDDIVDTPETTRFAAIDQAFLRHVPIPRDHIRRVRSVSEDELTQAKRSRDGLDTLTDSLAEDYEQQILDMFPESQHLPGKEPRFDLVLLDIGRDGGVGALLPEHILLGEHEWFVAWLGDGPSPSTHRITLTLPVINASHQVAFISEGAAKAEAVAEALERSAQTDVPMEEDRDVPAALVKTAVKPVVWFADDAASWVTHYPRSKFWRP